MFLKCFLLQLVFISLTINGIMASIVVTATAKLTIYLPTAAWSPQVQTLTTKRFEPSPPNDPSTPNGFEATKNTTTTTTTTASPITPTTTATTNTNTTCLNGYKWVSGNFDQDAIPQRKFLGYLTAIGNCYETCRLSYGIPTCTAFTFEPQARGRCYIYSSLPDAIPEDHSKSLDLYVICNQTTMAVDTTTPTTTTTTSHSSGGNCPTNWIHFNETDACYYLQNYTYTANQMWYLYTFHEAESNCQQMNAHLVSIHSVQEQNFILNLVYANARDIPNVVANNRNCLRADTWIGFLGDPMGNGNWTDGSPADYNPFLNPCCRGQLIYWGIANDPSCYTTPLGWTPITGPNGLNYGTSRYLCKTKAS